MVRFTLTVALWILLAADVIIVLPVAMEMGVLTLLFGFDSPDRPPYFPWVVLLLPVSVVAGTVAGALGALWLWRRPRWDLAAFPVGLALLGAALEFWRRFGPPV